MDGFAGKMVLAKRKDGVAILKCIASGDRVMQRKIFVQARIARTVEPGLDAGSTDRIVGVAADAQSRDLRDKIFDPLRQG